MRVSLYPLKQFLRLCDCVLTRKTQTIRFRGDLYRFYRTYWWDNVSQEIFDQEISPYFEALGEFRPSVVLDVGAASGHFAVVALQSLGCDTLYAFEPAKRQRILLARNARLNGVEKLVVEPFGLWNASGTLPFRTVGAESSFAPASRFQGVLDFPESLPVRTLDDWAKEKQLPRIDLIKMDAEGAELEILEGAKATLVKFRPRLLIQAYHNRDGSRTFERCAKMLESNGYEVREAQTGLLSAQ